MPYFDGTGPAGQGPMTGRGQGPCANNSWFGRGRGFGFGPPRRIGRGRGFGRRFARPFWNVQNADDSDPETLKAYEEDLQAELKEVQSLLKKK
jgi:hypothetical protein